MAHTLHINYKDLKLRIAKGQTKQVLEHLHMCFLAQDDYKNYLNEVILLSSNHQALERARRIDILNFQNYSTKNNQINNSVLELLDAIEAGRSIYQKDSLKVIPSWQIALFLFSMLLFILGMIGGGFYCLDSTEQQTIKDESIALTWDCPDYKDDFFQVLVLPFHDELNAQTAPHKLITDQLDRFCRKEELAAQISRLSNDETVKSVVTVDETQPFTQKCEPDMVVWGSTAVDDEGMDITTKYYIVNPFQFTQISSDNQTQVVDTKLHSFGSPKDFDKATLKIQEVLKTLLKVLIAYENKDYTTVIKSSQAIQDLPDNQSNKVLSLIEAESHFKLGNTDKAISAYGRVLNVDPTDELALSNRAHLSIEQKELSTALADLTTLIDVSKKPDYQIYQKRAKVNKELNDLGAAKADYMQAKKYSPATQQKQIEKEIDTIDSEIRIMDTNSKGEKGNNISNDGVLEKAKKDNKMGRTKSAEIKTKAFLKKHPNNPKAVEILVETKQLEKPDITISELKKIPELKNINEKSLARFKNPRFQTIIQNEKVSKYKKKKKVDNP